jgi:predicted flap endonuclease-1-like 5' DNA nuclease
MDIKRYDIKEIEGIGETYGHKLKLVGVHTTADLLTKAGTKKGRESLAAETGLPENLMLTWVNHADLMRINGIGGQISELLEASGVDTVRELAHRNAQNLHEKIEEVNDKFGLSGKVPSVKELQEMIAQATKMDKMVFH